MCHNACIFGLKIEALSTNGKNHAKIEYRAFFFPKKSLKLGFPENHPKCGSVSLSQNFLMIENWVGLFSAKMTPYMNV